MGYTICWSSEYIIVNKHPLARQQRASLRGYWQFTHHSVSLISDSYEECHVHLAGDLRKQSASIQAQDPNSPSKNSNGSPSQSNHLQHPQQPSSFPSLTPQQFGPRPPGTPMTAASLHPSVIPMDPSLEAPGTPGVMDLEMMEEDDDMSGGSSGPGNTTNGVGGMMRGMPNIIPPGAGQWAGFQPAGGFGGGGGGGGLSGGGSTTGMMQPGSANPLQQQSLQLQQQNLQLQQQQNIPQCVPPSLLSYAIPQSGTTGGMVQFNGFGFPTSSSINLSGSSRPSGSGSGSGSGSNAFLTPEQKAERAARKLARKEAKKLARDNGEGESSDDGRDAEGFKKYRCPVEGCNKSYKQANGLKYHLQ